MTPILRATLAAAATLAAGAALAAPAGKAPSYDGPWTVSMVTESGLCERSYNYAIAIDDGDIRLLSRPGDKPLNLSGQVGTGGNVSVTITRGPARVQAGGQLSRTSGGGSWNLPLLGCTGRWTASRQGGAKTASN